VVLEGLGRNLDTLVRKIRHLPQVDKDAINAILQELQRALLMADVKVEICLEVTERIRKKATDESISDKINRKEFIIKLLHDELIQMMGGVAAPARIKQNRENIMLLVGIQGSGKTTTIGKLAKYYLKKGMRIAVVCTDTWRPGAYAQLSQLLDQIKVAHYGEPEEKNALKIAKRGLKEFQKDKKNPYDLIIVDTAGRHKEEQGLMDEMQKLEEFIKPNETILIIDGTLGQQAYNQAQAFARTTHVGSIIITKLDGSAKGGGALSAAAASKAPIKFIGLGEKIDDLEEFNPSKFVGSLLGIPDIEGLLEKIKEAEIEPDEDMAKRLMKGKFTLEDLYQQLLALKKMGPFRKIIGMLGGQNIPDQLKVVAESNLEKWKVVLQSMTQQEKDNPDLIRKTRITRVARGSGTNYTEIKNMLKQYDQMKALMKNFTKPQRGKGKKGAPGMPGMPGMPGLPGFGGEMPDMAQLQKLQQMQGMKKFKKFK
jgi:signal recognition particle subunit SRP54